MCLGISVLTDLMIPFMSSAVVTGITGLVLLHVAVCKGWFGENKKKFLIRMWGVMGICLILMSGITFWGNGRFVTDYQVHRLEALITGEHWDYNYARNDYIWTYLFHYFGNVKGVFLVVVFAVFMALLLRMAVKQKNHLGYMLSIGCVIFLILQSLFYIGVNAGLYPISGNYMPFLSHGNMTMMITYFYMGILLSVYRNSNIVKN